MQWLNHLWFSCDSWYPIEETRNTNSFIHQPRRVIVLIEFMCNNIPKFTSKGRHLLNIEAVSWCMSQTLAKVKRLALRLPAISCQLVDPVARDGTGLIRNDEIWWNMKLGWYALATDCNSVGKHPLAAKCSNSVATVPLQRATWRCCADSNQWNHSPHTVPTNIQEITN